MELFKPKYDGIIEDTRSEKEKAKDWDSREIALGSGTGRKLTERDISIEYYDQEATSSCTSHAVLSMMDYNKVLKKEVSRLQLYRKRFNFPGEGSNATDLLQKAHSEHSEVGGLSLQGEYPSPLTEQFANSLAYSIGKDYALPFNYFTIRDWNELERTVNSGTAVTLAFYSTVSEWSREYVEERDSVTPDNARVRHQITLMPNGSFIENGKRWFSVLDSSQFGRRKVRYATLDFFRNRVIVQPQFALPKNVPVVELPKVNKTLSACKLGDRGQAVTNMQGFLADNGFLDKKYVTGFYGPISSASVLWFQLYYHEQFNDSIPELLKLKGEFFGRQSISVANSIKTS